MNAARLPPISRPRPVTETTLLHAVARPLLVARSALEDFKVEEVGRNRNFPHASDLTRVARSSRAGHVTQERLHRFGMALNIDEDRAIGPVRHRTNYAVALRRFGYPRPIIHSLYATDGDIVPMDEGVHRTHKSKVSMPFPTSGLSHRAEKPVSNRANEKPICEGETTSTPQRTSP